MSLDLNLTSGEMWTNILGYPVSDIAGVVLSIDLMFFLFLIAIILSLFVEE